MALHKKHGKTNIHNYVMNDSPGRANQQGSIHDLIKAWRILYRAKGWDRVAAFDNKGDLNTPYIMFKEKMLETHKHEPRNSSKSDPFAPVPDTPCAGSSRKLAGHGTS